MANNLDGILKAMNRTKLEELKKKAENGELSRMLNSVDTEKAKQMISDLGLSDKTKNVDLGKLIKEVKKNPDVLKELKKLF